MSRWMDRLMDGLMKRQEEWNNGWIVMDVNVILMAGLI